MAIDKATKYPNGIEVGEDGVALKGDVEKPVVPNASTDTVGNLAADVDALRDALVTLGLISAS